jgi:endonuclease/exonuclease/phosphatase family metal-dependent hydrolase
MTKLTKIQINKKRPLQPKFDGVFRIVNWNTANDDPLRNCCKDERVVDAVLSMVQRYNANVICLQELQGSSFELISKTLEKKGWDCFFDWKESGRGFTHLLPDWRGLNGHAICVKGHGSNYKCEKMSQEEPTRYGWEIDWWYYMQIDYQGKTITCVHVRDHWKKKQIPELHKKVTSGIISGDFNHKTPDKSTGRFWSNPGWFQTDLDREWTHSPGGKNHAKIDHILSIDKPQAVEGGAIDFFGSNHRLVVASILFPKRAKPGIERPVTKKPIPIKPITKISPKKTVTSKKKTTRKSGTKKKVSKSIVTRKILRKKTR